MTTVCIIGDTHADATFVANIHRAIKPDDVDVIVQLGDFGFTFPDSLLHSIYAWLDKEPGRLWYWIDGNHDEHNYIQNVIMDGESGDFPISHFHERMFYCPRGSVAMIGNKKALFVGGAYSIDKRYRVPDISWWSQEMITHADVDHALENVHRVGGAIDVMFTHDSPNHRWLVNELSAHGYKVDQDSYANRMNLTSIVERVHPKVLYHGHYHWRYSEDFVSQLDGWIVHVEGVGANISSNTYGMDPTARRNHNFLIEEW